MKIIFCPKCGNRLRKFVKGKFVEDKFIENKNGNLFGVCINQHFIPLDNSEAHLKYKIKREKTLWESPIVRDEDRIDVLETVSINCPHCSGTKGKIVYSYTSYGDEENTTIFKCLSCGKSFRSGYRG